MEPREYQRWLSGRQPSESLASPGDRLFHALRLQHLPSVDRTDVRAARARRPLFGTTVPLAGGGTAIVRRSVHPRLDPRPSTRRSSPATSRSCRRSRGSQRGRAARAHRIHQVAECARTLRVAMTATARIECMPPDPDDAGTREHYLNAATACKSWLLTTRPQADRAALPGRRSRSSSSSAGRSRVLIRLELADARRRPRVRRDLQQAVHDARRDDGLLLPDPVDPGGARQLPRAADDRREGPGVPAAEPASWYIYMLGGVVHALRR